MGLFGSGQKVAPNDESSPEPGTKSVMVQKAKDIAFSGISMGKEQAEHIVEKVRTLLSDFAKRKIQGVVDKLVDKIPGLLKDALEDDDMPRCVSSGKDNLVEMVWPDIREEIMYEVSALLDALPEEQQEQDERSPACCLLAFLRYHMFPYDKGFWGKLHDPVYVILKVISMIPVMGVSPFFFLFVFLIIDKSDSFQCVNFILGFKGTQFLAMGVIRAITGMLMFFRCVSGNAHDSDHTCDTNGPGTGASFFPTLGGFVIQVVICWIAFFFLRCSKDHGRLKMKGVVEHNEQLSDAASRGALKYFLWYDLVSFLLCIGGIGFVVSTRPANDLPDWPLMHAVYAAQIVYALLSVPFFIFTLPGLNLVLTHARPTAYDRNGIPRKPISPAIEERREEIKTGKDEKDDFCNAEEADGMLQKFKLW